MSVREQAAIRGYRDLMVWQKAMELAAECYRLTAAFPKSEIYGITSQLRRAATSVPANIAEGRGRRKTGDFIRFLDTAYGSLVELETHIMLAERLGFTDATGAGSLLTRATEIGRMLNGLRTSLRAKRTLLRDADDRHSAEHSATHSGVPLNPES